MNEGVKIILERMKTHPEEFVPEYDGGTTKWNSIIGRYHNYLTKEESEAIVKSQKDTVNEVMRERFTQAVMKELLDPKEQMEQVMAPYQQGTGSAGLTLGAYPNTAGMTLTVPNGGTASWAATNTTQLANTLTLGQTSVQEHELQHMKAHLEYLKQEAQAQQAKRNTLVGKLYNYLGSNK